MPDTLVKDEAEVTELQPADLFYVSVYAGVGDDFLDRAVSFANFASSIASREVTEEPGGTINGSNDTFTLSETPIDGTLQVFLNGLLQRIHASGDLTVSGATLTFNPDCIPQSGDTLLAVYKR